MQINDRYEFPLQLDLDRDDGKYLAPDADRSIRNLYTLHR
jgi:ubiquitin carboxyl-terminal hydrolase 7